MNLNLSELRDLIRAEAQIAGIEEKSTLIDSLINEELQSFTGKSKYEELLTSTPLVATNLGQNVFDLPVDYQLFSSVVWTQNVPDPCPLPLSRGLRTQSQTYSRGTPMYYVLAAGKMNVYPWLDATIGDIYTLWYYKLPELILDTDIFPVRSLERAVRSAVMARMLRFVDSKLSNMAKSDSIEAYRNSRSEREGQ